MVKHVLTIASSMGMSFLQALCLESNPQCFRDAETTILIKFAFWRGLGRRKIYGKLAKHAIFLRNSMTIKFGNFANFIVRIFFVIWGGS